MTEKITEKLTQAYTRLGVTDPAELQSRTEEALRYYAQDRERYIELAEPDTPVHLVDISHGATGHLIPFAQARFTKAADSFTSQITKNAALWVSDGEVRFISQILRTDLPRDPAEEERLYHASYEKARLEDFTGSFQLLPPQDIIPAATEQDREIYDLLCRVFDRTGSYYDPRIIPHKAERALEALGHAPEEELQADGKSVTGRAVTLASDSGEATLHREDHSYSRSRSLLLLADRQGARLLMKIHHIYRYFRRVPQPDALYGDCIFEDTGEKQEITYHSASLADVHEDFIPTFY